MLGFCKLDVKPLGPLQTYVVAPPAFKFKVLVAHTGELLVMLRVGRGVTLTFATTVDVQPFVPVPTTLYCVDVVGETVIEVVV